MIIVLAPLLVHSLNSDILDHERDLMETINFQEALEKVSERSLAGVVLNRGDGTFCGLIVEDQNVHSSMEESKNSNPSFLAVREDLRKVFAQSNIPLCSSFKDLKVIEQTNEALEIGQLKMDQILEDDHPVQIAGLGRVLFSSPLRAAITSIAGTCLISSSPWIVAHTYVFFVYIIGAKDRLRDLGLPMGFLAIGVSFFGGAAASIAGAIITGVNLEQVTRGNAFKKAIVTGGGGVGTGIISLVTGQICFWGLPTLLDSIFSQY